MSCPCWARQSRTGLTASLVAILVVCVAFTAQRAAGVAVVIDVASVNATTLQCIEDTDGLNVQDGLAIIDCGDVTTSAAAMTACTAALYTASTTDTSLLPRALVTVDLNSTQYSKGAAVLSTASVLASNLASGTLVRFTGLNTTAGTANARNVGQFFIVLARQIEAEAGDSSVSAGLWAEGTVSVPNPCATDGLLNSETGNPNTRITVASLVTPLKPALNTSIYVVNTTEAASDACGFEPGNTFFRELVSDPGTLSGACVAITDVTTVYPGLTAVTPGAGGSEPTALATGISRTIDSAVTLGMEGRVAALGNASTQTVALACLSDPGLTTVDSADITVARVDCGQVSTLALAVVCRSAIVAVQTANSTRPVFVSFEVGFNLSISEIVSQVSFFVVAANGLNVSRISIHPVIERFAPSDNFAKYRAALDVLALVYRPSGESPSMLLLDTQIRGRVCAEGRAFADTDGVSLKSVCEGYGSLTCGLQLSSQGLETEALCGFNATTVANAPWAPTFSLRTTGSTECTALNDTGRLELLAFPAAVGAETTTLSIGTVSGAALSSMLNANNTIRECLVSADGIGTSVPIIECVVSDESMASNCVSAVLAVQRLATDSQPVLPQVVLTFVVSKTPESIASFAGAVFATNLTSRVYVNIVTFISDTDARSNIAKYVSIGNAITDRVRVSGDGDLPLGVYVTGAVSPCAETADPIGGYLFESEASETLAEQLGAITGTSWLILLKEKGGAASGARCGFAADNIVVSVPRIVPFGGNCTQVPVGSGSPIAQLSMSPAATPTQAVAVTLTAVDGVLVARQSAAVLLLAGVLSLLLAAVSA